MGSPDGKAPVSASTANPSLARCRPPNRGTATVRDLGMALSE